ncbi:MAG: hypothetical protein KKE17_03250 [Proteobacteria bacterium]|nr:hypothetical protein [Pseudomonadota bacterium]
MRDLLEITIFKNSIELSHPEAPERIIYVRDQDSGLGDMVERFCAEAGVSTNTVVFYVSEDLLYYKLFQLPVNTPNLKEAIRYQLGLLTPFDPDSMLYSFSVVPGKEMHDVSLFAAETHAFDEYFNVIAEGGFQIAGLFPESQRYVGSSIGKEDWALVIPSHFMKTFVFSGTQLKDRFVCYGEPSFADLAKVTRTEKIYHPTPPEGSSFLDASTLLEGKPALKDFNMLPASFRRPDYLRTVIKVLLVLNAVAVLAWGGVKEYRLLSAIKQTDQAIVQIAPKVREANALRARLEKLQKSEEMIKDFKNPDLIGFIEKLTKELPLNSYLDMIRMDKDQPVIRVMGYTENVGDLTVKLQNLGDTQLKSTSRRQNKTYFHVETKL